MTDFLTRLVGRTLGLTPIVQARIPSIYEPEAEKPENALPKLAIVNPQSSTLQASTTANSLELTTALSSPFVEESSLKPEIAAQPVSNSVSDESLESLSLSPFNREILSHTEEDTCIGEFSEGSKMSVAQRHEEQERKQNTPSSLSQIGLETSRNKLSISAIDRTNQPEKAIAKLIDEQNVEVKDSFSKIEVEKNSPTLSQQNFENYATRPKNFQVQSSTPQTIRVTIGRIEVRAISPPSNSPKPRKTSPAPKLSLSDYLKQTGG